MTFWRQLETGINGNKSIYCSKTMKNPSMFTGVR